MQQQIFQLFALLAVAIVQCSMSLAIQAAPASIKPSSLKAGNRSLATNHTSSVKVGNKSIEAHKVSELNHTASLKLGNKSIEAHKNELSKHQHGKFSKQMNAMDAQAQLSQLMAASQMKLAAAERKHGKLVKRNRKELKQFIEDNGRKISKAIRQYVDELDQAAADLQEAVNTSNTLLAQEEMQDEQDKQDAPSWNGPVMTQRAQIAAKIGSAQRELRRLARHRAVVLRQAGERAKDVLEGDSEHHLRSKLGDLTPLFSDVEKNIDNELMYMDLEGPSVTGKHQNFTEVPKQQGRQARLKSLGASLDAAVKSSKTAVAVAEKNFTASLSGASNQTETRTAQMEKNLVDAEQREIKEIRGEKK